MKRRPQSGSSPEVAIPITPMLDVAFQLLAFFILTYNPFSLEGQVNLSLPANPFACGDHLEPPPDEGLVFQIPDELNVLLQTREVGYTITLEEGWARTHCGDLTTLRKHLTRLYQDKQAAIADKARNLQGEPAREAFKADQLRRFAIKVQGDSELKWGTVVEVLDSCRQAGFANVRFAAPPDFGQGRK